MRAYARQLERKEQIQNMSNHHKGMARLKEWMGDPRPEGMTLSLVNHDGPEAYDGYTHKKGKRVPYRLSTSVSDYIWESQPDNNLRRPSFQE